MTSEAKSLIKLQNKTWMKLVEDKEYLSRVNKIIDKKIRDIDEDNFISADHKVKLRALRVMAMELSIRVAKYNKQDISHDKDAIAIQTMLPKSWADLDKHLGVLERITTDMTKERIRGGFLGKDFKVEFTLLQMACAELDMRESKKLKEPMWSEE